AGVWNAIRAVWTSALGPLAHAYARGRPLAVAVIVQRYVPGERVTVYTRGAPDEIWVQRGDHVTKLARTAIDPSSDVDHACAEIALRCEAAIAAELSGAAVELVLPDASAPVWVVQARPIVR